jgi:hypothetical protein
MAYRLYRQCYEGSGGFAPKLKRIDKGGAEQTARAYLAAVAQDESFETYLVPHGREHAEDFKDRLEQSHIFNVVKHRGIQPLTGFLCDQEPDRQNHPTEFEAWRDNATVDDLGFDAWKAEEGIPYGQVYGSFPCVIDSDPHTATNEQERLNQGADTAKLRVIHPDNIIDWRLGRGGHLEAIKYKAVVEDSDLFKGHESVDRYVYVTPLGWMWVDDPKDQPHATDLKVGGSGVWPWVGNPSLVQRAPIVELKFFNGESGLKDIAPPYKRLFNMISECGELERKQPPVFYAHEEGSEEPKPGEVTTIGASNWHPCADSAPFPPGFASPDSTCLDHYLKNIEIYADRIVEMFGTASIFGASAEAAATLAYRFQTTEKKLKAMAASLGRFENDCAEVVMLWRLKALDDKISTEYTASFDAVAVERLLAQISQLKTEIGPLPPTAQMLLEKRAFNAVMPDVPEEEQENLKKEWELSVEEKAHADETDPDAAEDVIPPATVPVPKGAASA